jgi:hypothetical protein
VKKHFDSKSLQPQFGQKYDQKKVRNNKAGNAIDFFVQVLGLSFNDAMAHIATGQNTATPSAS